MTAVPQIDGLATRVAAWIADDPDPADRAELSELLADPSPAAEAELAGRFADRPRIRGTGMRGTLGAGPCRMNLATVTAAAAALADWLLAGGAAGHAAEAGVVVGCDAAQLNDAFATQAARVLAGAGIRVHILGCVPQPLLSFAVRYLSATAGVMIAASAGPEPAAGVEIYLADGALLVPPADTDLDAALADVGPLATVPLAAPDDPLICPTDCVPAYLDTVCERFPAPRGAAWLRFAYTALHGVAGSSALRAFERAGFAAPDVVTAQLEPDPGFPTVDVPDPARQGSLDLAFAQARRAGADLVLAHDPAGARLVVAVEDPDAPGGYRPLTGDQLGALLGAYLLAGQAEATGRSLVASTVVSGSMLTAIATAAGAEHAQTLSGFQWIARAGELRAGTRFVFGYDTELGYAPCDVARDADGIAAALALLCLAAQARSAGQTVQDVYDELEITHGVHVTERLRVPTANAVDLMARLRIAPPAEIGTFPVLSITDHTGGSWDVPSADILAFRLHGGRVVITPRGGAGVGVYLEVTEPTARATLTRARQLAGARLEVLRSAVMALLSQLAQGRP